MNLCIELHDSTVEAIRTAGPDAVVELTVYVHGSSGRPGVDAGTGWYQPAEMLVSEFVLDQTPSGWPLDLYDGVVSLDAERFTNVVPLPFDRIGQVRVALNGDEGTLAMSGSRVRIVLTGIPATAAPFPGLDE